jgi:3-hydroxyisobutyrate dehydrogenase
MLPNSFLIDHTTSSPDLAKRLYKICSQKQISCLDAPVSGGDTGAKNGTLVTMVGGDRESYE